MGGLHLGQALPDVLVLGDHAPVTQEVLVTARHLEEVGALELLDNPHLVSLGLDLVGMPDGLVNGVPYHVERRVLVVDSNLEMNNSYHHDLMFVQYYHDSVSHS